MAPTSRQPSRQEQRELDELLSDIYKGIEKLPDTNGRYVQVAVSPQSRTRDSNNNNAPTRHLFASSRREYELPASSPLVQEYKRDIAALTGRPQAQQHQQQHLAAKPQQVPLQSSLKRETPETAHAQSLGSFMSNSLTPENRRRVRILEERPVESQTSGSKGGKVRQVNTNKFIYHQEKNPDDADDAGDFIDYADDSNDYAADENEDLEASRGGNNLRGGRKIRNSNQVNTHEDVDDDDDLDGVTRVEFYRTSWLDRQLGRAHRRRSSKELSERQVKEKAMIEELKRNLKNGAITLRRSLKGGGGGSGSRQHNKQAAATAPAKNRQDDSYLFEPQHEQSRTSGRVLTPAPSSTSGKRLQKSERYYSPAQTQAKSAPKSPNLAPSQLSNQSMNRTISASNYNSPQLAATRTPPKQVTTTITSHRVDPQSSPYSSRTLPHNYQLQQQQQQQQQYQPAQVNPSSPQPAQQQQQQQQQPQPHHTQTLAHTTTQRHQLIQQHARAGSNLQRSAVSPHRNYNTLGPSHLANQSNSTMRNPAYNCNTIGPSHNSMTNKQQQQQQQQQTPNMTGANQQHQELISSMPSATNVVRSALSRSSSQVSLNQLNKTINMLSAETPPGTRHNVGSPMTPTQTLKAATPSLSPSPVAGSPAPRVASPCYSSKTLSALDSRQHQQSHQPQSTITRLHGTRIIEPKPTQTAQQQQQPYRYQPQQQQQQQQPVYANPHASLMQHRAEQQLRQPSKNVASIREFNELDSLLRSLSPRGGTSNTNITPGYSSRPTQASLGGYMPAAVASPGPTATRLNSTHGSSASDVYARVQKQPTGNYLQQHQGNSNVAAANVTQPPAHSEPYVIDVTNKNKEVDENCLRRPQNVSEFEPPVELLPSMEDYQNISKLNPVKNHYWYKPNMSRDRAISLLKDKPQGTFIVRDSTSFGGAYGLAVKVSKLPKNVLNNASLRNSNSDDPSAELIRHFLIEPTSNGVRLKGYANEPVFGSLPSLIYQHSLTELALPCKLLIPRADIEDPSFNHKQKRFFDEFIASKEQAKHAPYDRTSPNGGYRKYPGDVYVHNEHRIIFQ